MSRADYLAWSVAALLVVSFADWLYRWRYEAEGQPQGLSASTLIDDNGAVAEAAVQNVWLGASSGLTRSGALSAAWALSVLRNSAKVKATLGGRRRKSRLTQAHALHEETKAVLKSRRAAKSYSTV